MSDGWTSDLFALLPHPSTSRVLMFAGEDGWSLPSILVTSKIDLTPGLATREMSRSLGFPVLAYRYAHIAEDEHRRRQAGIFAFESGEHVGALSARNRWVNRAGLAGLRLDPPNHRKVVDAYLRELETSIIPEYRPPWERPGWFALAASWITETLGSLGYDVLTPPEQVRWWSLSCVLRVATSHGEVYFKTSARQPLFANEPVLLSYLASQFPRRVPALIASDPSRG